MSKKVLVTGASGFLGYHIINACIEKDLDVYAAIRPGSNIEHLKGINVQYLFLDYEDEESMARQLSENGIAFIIHAAGVTKAIRQDIYNDINATYTLNLGRAAAHLGIDFKKMVFISSLAAVGPLQYADVKITESTAPKPVTAYGRSKLLAEESLAGIKIPLIILRPTAIYGPRDKDIFLMVKTVNKGLDPYIGKASQQLSFVHARDVADAAVQSLFLEGAFGVYNITDGNSYNRYQFSDMVKDILKKKALRFHIPMPLVKVLAFFLETTNRWMKKPAVINSEKLHELAAKNWVCDITKAKEELMFSPKFDLRKGLENSIEWYHKNNWM